MSGDPFMAPLRELLNRQIERSTQAREAADSLEGHTLALRLRNTGLVLYLGLHEGHLEISRKFDGEPHAALETTPFGLAELARGKVAGGRLAMTGDPVVAQRFEQLLRATRPDWEDELSRIVGDVAAHQIGNTLRSLAAFGRHAAERLSGDTVDYLSEERRELIAPSEIEHFNRQVTEVARRADELEKELARLRTDFPE